MSSVLYIASIVVSVKDVFSSIISFFLIHDVEAVLWKTFPGVHYFSNARLCAKKMI